MSDIYFRNTNRLDLSDRSKRLYDIVYEIRHIYNEEALEDMLELISQEERELVCEYLANDIIDKNIPISEENYKVLQTITQESGLTDKAFLHRAVDLEKLACCVVK